MTVREAAQRLEVSSSTVYGLVASGRLKCYRIGRGRGTIRFSEAHIVEFLTGAEPVIEQAPTPVQRVRLKHIRL